MVMVVVVVVVVVEVVVEVRGGGVGCARTACSVHVRWLCGRRDCVARACLLLLRKQMSRH